MANHAADEPAVGDRMILLFRADGVGGAGLRHFLCHRPEIRLLRLRGWRDDEKTATIGENMPYLHVFLSVAAEFRPEIADVCIIVDDAAFDETVEGGGAGGLAGGIDGKDRIFIHLLRAGPIHPACTDVDF